MSDVRKPKSQSQDNQSDKKTLDRIATQNATVVHVNAWSLLARAAMIAGIVFFAGFTLTLLASSLYDFKDLPLKGDTQFTNQQPQSFYAYYPKMRKFAITDDPNLAGTETKFTQLGDFGTGLFVYTVVNTFHWIMEIGFPNLGGMILIPLLVLVVGSIIFFFKMLPRSMQKPDIAISVGIGISMLHSVILLLFFVLALQIFPLFKELFARPYFYSGDILMTTTRAGAAILLMTSFTYGVISGGILYALVSFWAFIRRLERPR